MGEGSREQERKMGIPSSLFPVPLLLKAARHSRVSRWIFPKTSKEPPSQFSLVGSCLNCWDCCHEVPETGWLRKTFILSQFWRLEVRDHGVSRALPAPKVLGKDVVHVSLQLLEVPAHVKHNSNLHLVFLLCVCLSLVRISSFYKNTSHIWLVPSLVSCLNLITSIGKLSPKKVTFWSAVG